MNLKQTLQDNNNDLQKQFEEHANISELLKNRSQTIDKLLQSMWKQEHLDSLNLSNKVSLVAVGGYGREEMHPASDVDLLILLSDEPDEQAQETLSSFVTLLWDLGLEIGHSVRTLNECINEAKNDLTIITNLIESRYLCGDKPLFDTLQSSISTDKIWSSADFFLAKLDEQKSRYKRFGDSAYRVEPNLKEGPGGLRDLQTIGWITRREYDVPSLKALSETSHFDLLNPDEYKDLIKSRDFLWQVRFILHQLTGRKEDRLLFDHQRHLAHAFGYTDDAHNQSIESFMQRYYRNILRVERLNELLIGLLREHILKTTNKKAIKINAYYNNHDGYLGLEQEHFFSENPHGLLEVFHIIQTTENLKGMTPKTIRALRRNTHLINDDFRSNTHNKQIFINIVSESQGITFALRRMNRYGILAAYIPAFANIVGRMQYDLFHAYTVDEHTLNVVRNIRRLSTEEGKEELPFCAEIFKTLQNPMILYLAGLFHDIAKGRGGSHSELGAVDALNFCLNHELSQTTSETVSNLVNQHLILSSTAQRKDISDPEIIKEIADLMETQEHLNMLYLLTICDIRGTNPTLLNNWKHSLLKNLYRNTTRYLESDKPKNLTQNLIKEKRQSLDNQAQNSEQYGKFLARFNDDYILHYPVEELLWQFSEITKQPNKTIVTLCNRDSDDSSHLFIYSKDQDNFFIKITSAIEQRNLTIVAANIASTHDDFALNTFYLLTPEGVPLDNKQDIEKLTEAVSKNIVEKDFSFEFKQEHLSRQHKHFDINTKVIFEQDNIHQQTYITIKTADTSGLLTQIANIFNEQNLEVHNAKITTLGETVEDTFQITTKSGLPIIKKEQQDQIKKAFLESLNS
ncbi:MAG: [protein-PII] uridylyltransferase [Cocleimonas sp.]